ncbi:atherin-like [Cygnus atratus]|uniref:atherin-like n=1 Tax=Cygnus atratus TaxID=8868 RepID=UPI0021B7C3CB|nr:atherin-like [Cygnus atratus]
MKSWWAPPTSAQFCKRLGTTFPTLPQARASSRTGDVSLTSDVLLSVLRSHPAASGHPAVGCTDSSAPLSLPRNICSNDSLDTLIPEKTENSDVGDPPPSRTQPLPGPNSLRRRPSQLPPPARSPPRHAPLRGGGSRGEHRRTPPAAAGGALRGRPRDAPPLWFAPLPGQRIQRARGGAAVRGGFEGTRRGL